MSFLGLLALLFIGLKLTSFIDWSWWFVLMPVYLPVIVIITLSFFAIYFTGKK
jgi:hypothetical protein